MNKQKLIQTVEKARPQTKCQAARVIDTLIGVRSHPFAKKERGKRKLQKSRPPEIDKKVEDKLNKS